MNGSLPDAVACGGTSATSASCCVASRCCSLLAIKIFDRAEGNFAEVM